MLRRYAGDWILAIEDISGFVAERRARADPARWSEPITPREDVYPAHAAEAARHLGIA
jgi:hypothetical protein